MKQASYAKLRDGTFGLRGIGLVEGETVNVTTKAGNTSLVMVGRIVAGPFDDGNVLALKASAETVSLMGHMCKTCGGTGRVQPTAPPRTQQSDSVATAARRAWGADSSAPASAPALVQDAPGDDIPF